MINRVLVALDGSSRAPDVFDAAAEIALRFDAALDLLRVIVVPPEFPPAAHMAVGDPLIKQLIGAAEADLARIADRSPVRIDGIHVRQGRSWRAILDVSELLDVDLVVIGSHGYHVLERMVGTTAARVSNLSRRNVLVVHEKRGASRSSTPGEATTPS